MAKAPSTGAGETGEVVVDISAVIRATFEDIYAQNEKIAAAKAKHVEPLTKKRLVFYRDLKTITGINRKAIDAMYAQFEIAKDAEKLEDEDHRDKVLDDMRILHESMGLGGQADWVAALELAAKTEMPALPKK